MRRSILPSNNSHRRKVVIVTQELDPHAEAVMDELSCIDIECLRLHPASLLTDWMFSINLDDFDDSSVRVQSSQREMKFSEVLSVYYRKPDPPAVASSGNASVDQFRIEEACGSRDALFQMFDTLWFNNPYVTRRSGHKLFQMQVARKFGLLTPRTLLTNRPEQAIDFVRREPGQRAVIKPLAGVSAIVEGRLKQCNCRQITLADLDNMADSIAASPLILQQYLPKLRDIRVTIIAETVVACAIHSQELVASTDDWRNVRPDLLRHEIIELPTPLIDKLLQVQRYFKVPFGAVDLVEDPDGQFWFLENNLNGQWLWIEHLTGYPLARTMANALARHTS